MEARLWRISALAFVLTFSQHAFSTSAISPCTASYEVGLKMQVAYGWTTWADGAPMPSDSYCT